MFADCFRAVPQQQSQSDGGRKGIAGAYGIRHLCGRTRMFDKSIRRTYQTAMVPAC